MEWSRYDRNGADVLVMVVRPGKKREFPVVFFQHGRRGLDDLIQRRRVSETAINSLRKKGRDARVIIYPGVGRGFYFRPENVRTFADDLQLKMQYNVRQHL